MVWALVRYAAARRYFRRGEPPAVAPPSLPASLAVGSGIGFLSGVTGTGGGIFLTPLLLFSNWAKTKQASAVSALFILANSIAGLAGFVSATQSIPALAAVLSGAAIIGGAVGSHLGSRKFPVRTISILLATVLVIAGCKLIFTR